MPACPDAINVSYKRHSRTETESYYLRLSTLNALIPARRTHPPALRVCSFLLILLAPFLIADVKKKLVADPDTPDGKFLELINLESDDARKLALIEQFTVTFPKSVSIGWAYSQIQDIHIKQGRFDKAIQAGDKVLELDPDDLDAAQQSLLVARIMEDQALTKKYSDLSSAIARRLSTAPPILDDPDDAVAQKKRLEAAADLLVKEEYALYDQAFTTVDPRGKIQILDQLLKLNPRTRYLKDTLLMYFLACRQLNETSKALAAAERLLQADPGHEDVLLFLADYHFRRKQETRRVLEYCDRIVALMNSKKKPGALSEAEWNHQKAVYSGTAYYMAGTVYFNEKRYEPADHSLRLALPLFEGSSTMLPAVLTSLGWVNYQLGRYSEAVRFYKQCMPFGGIYKEQAEKNLAAIKAEQGLE
jgi:tetratricopeptide (TPR) repeat protein